MGGGGSSGVNVLRAAGASDKPKRPSVSGIKFARELADKNDGTHLKSLKSQLFADVDSFSKTGKVSEHTSSYRIIYKNGQEVVIRYKDGKEIILQDGKRVKSFQLTGISYIGKANGNQEFKDSLGFNSSDKKGQKIFESKNRFESYNKEIKRLFGPKADIRQRSKKKSTGTSKKSTTKRSTTKKSASKKSTTTKKPTSSPTKNTAAKPKVWERGKKTVVRKKKK